MIFFKFLLPKKSSKFYLKTKTYLENGGVEATRMLLRAKQSTNAGSWTMALVFKDQYMDAIFSSLEADVTQSQNNEVISFTSKSFVDLNMGQQYFAQAMVENLNWDLVPRKSCKSSLVSTFSH